MTQKSQLKCNGTRGLGSAGMHILIMFCVINTPTEAINFLKRVNSIANYKNDSLCSINKLIRKIVIIN